MLDSYIEKMVEQFSDDMKKKRQELVEERKGENTCLLYPRKLCLWEGILFSRPSDRPTVCL